MSATVDSTAVDLCRILRRALREFCYKFLFCISFRALCSTSRVRSAANERRKTQRARGPGARTPPAGPATAGPNPATANAKAACRLAERAMARMLEGTSRNARCSKCTRRTTHDTHSWSGRILTRSMYSSQLSAAPRDPGLDPLAHSSELDCSACPICAPCYCLRARATLPSPLLPRCQVCAEDGLY